MKYIDEMKALVDQAHSLTLADRALGNGLGDAVHRGKIAHDLELFLRHGNLRHVDLEFYRPATKRTIARFRWIVDPNHGHHLIRRAFPPKGLRLHPGLAVRLVKSSDDLDRSHNAMLQLQWDPADPHTTYKWVGIVSRVGDKFGFVLTDRGQSAFIPPQELRSWLKQGQRVRFTAAYDHGKLQAHSVELAAA